VQPLDVKVADGKPWWQKLPLPAANQLVRFALLLCGAPGVVASVQ
jgi:hypothetical protein